MLLLLPHQMVPYHNPSLHASCATGLRKKSLKKACQKKGVLWTSKQVNLSQDYAPSILRDKNTPKLRVLKEKGIRFQTPFPATRVFYQDGTLLYNSVKETTKMMSEKGLPITVIKPPETPMEQKRRLTWTTTEQNRRQRAASTMNSRGHGRSRTSYRK